VLDPAGYGPYKARNENSVSGNVTQFYYFGSIGSDAGAVLKGPQARPDMARCGPFLLLRERRARAEQEE